MLLAQTASLPQPVPPHKGKEAEGRRKRHSERLELPQASVSPTAGPCGRRPGHGGEVVQIGGGGSPEQERARLPPKGGPRREKHPYSEGRPAGGSRDGKRRGICSRWSADGAAREPSSEMEGRVLCRVVIMCNCVKLLNNFFVI